MHTYIRMYTSCIHTFIHHFTSQEIRNQICFSRRSSPFFILYLFYMGNIDIEGGNTLTHPTRTGGGQRRCWRSRYLLCHISTPLISLSLTLHPPLLRCCALFLTLSVVFSRSLSCARSLTSLSRPRALSLLHRRSRAAEDRDPGYPIPRLADQDHS
jgi:hypothetical protein